MHRVGPCKPSAAYPAEVLRALPVCAADPAYHVTRSMEDFVTWAGDASQKRHIARYSNKLDDFDLLQL